jgi:ech hydrogenase subunit F
MANMLKLVFKNLFNKPATRLYPVAKENTFERTRGRIFFDQTDCIYCSICARKCPADAIKVTRATNTWELDTLRCIICSECVNVCPKKSITMNSRRRPSSSNKKIITFTRVKEEPVVTKETVTKE